MTNRILKSTVDLMLSPNYRDRFIAEYIQLKNRFNGLLSMITKWHEGKLDFTPSCPYEIYKIQLEAMERYLDVLVIRAKIEGIDLNGLEC